MDKGTFSINRLTIFEFDLFVCFEKEGDSVDDITCILLFFNGFKEIFCWVHK